MRESGLSRRCALRVNRGVAQHPSADDDALESAKVLVRLLAEDPSRYNRVTTSKLELAGEQKIDLRLPRMQLEFGVEDLKPHLKAMGLSPIFDLDGGFVPMVPSDNSVHVDSVLHKAVCTIDEEGTVAAAATAVVMMSRGLMPVPPRVVTFDRPFVFAIESGNGGGELLFLGLVANPGK